MLSEDGGRAVIAWPWRNWGANLPQLMASVLVGEGCETARFTRCRLVALEWPAALVAALGGGPRFGLEGVRAWLGPGAETRPLLGGIVKPSLGLGPAEVAATAAALARGGCDMVKDDELLADPDWCPAAGAGQPGGGGAGRGRPALPVRRQHLRARRHAPGAGGGGGGRRRRERSWSTPSPPGSMPSGRWPPPVSACRCWPTGSAPVRSPATPRSGVDGSVLCELTRIAGADLVQIGGFGGKLFDTRTRWPGTWPPAAARSWAPGCPSRSTAAAYGPVRRRRAGAAGSDMMLLLGMGAYEHPGGPEAGARSVAQAIEAVTAGESLESAAESAPRPRRRPGPLRPTLTTTRPAGSFRRARPEPFPGYTGVPERVAVGRADPGLQRSSPPTAGATGGQARMRGVAETEPIPRTVEWRDGAVRLIDQRQLPGRLRFLDCRTVDEVCDAISTLAIRGAPALGAAGGYGVALACALAGGGGPRVRPATVVRAAADAADRLIATRPTAVNLAWGAHRVLAAAQAAAMRDPVPPPVTPEGRPPRQAVPAGRARGRGGDGQGGGAAGGGAVGGAGRGRQPGPGAPRRGARARGGAGADALQRRGAGLRRVRHGARGDPGGGGGGQERPGCGSTRPGPSSRGPG